MSVVSTNSRTSVELGMYAITTIAFYYILATLLPHFFPYIENHLIDLRLRMACLYPYLVIGYLLGKYQLMDKLRTHVAGAISIALLMVGLIYYRYYQPELQYLSYGLWDIHRLIALSTFASLVYVLGTLTDTGGRVGRGLVFLGQWSLPIYFVHYFFLPVFPGIRTLLGLISAEQRLSVELAVFLGGTILTLVPTLIVVYCIKLNPYLDFALFGEKNRLLKR